MLLSTSDWVVGDFDNGVEEKDARGREESE